MHDEDHDDEDHTFDGTKNGVTVKTDKATSNMKVSNMLRLYCRIAKNSRT